jgi:hypothetical protein
MNSKSDESAGLDRWEALPAMMLFVAVFALLFFALIPSVYYQLL